MLQEEKRQIEENPEIPIAKNTKILRQKNFKANFIKKTSHQFGIVIGNTSSSKCETVEDCISGQLLKLQRNVVCLWSRI